MNVWWATSETVFQHIYLYWCFHLPAFISNLQLSYSAEADSGWALRQGIENMWLLHGAWSSSQHGDSSWLDLRGGLGLHNASPSWQSGNCALCTFVATGFGVLYCVKPVVLNPVCALKSPGEIFWKRTYSFFQALTFSLYVSLGLRSVSCQTFGLSVRKRRWYDLRE